MTEFLSVDEAIAIRDRLTEAFGGSSGLRDPGALESALFRPQTGYYDDLPQMAAALFESLLKSHPFVDANKRVAFLATDVFLRRNGWKFEVEAESAPSFLIGHLEEGTCDVTVLEAWIRKSIVARP